MTVRETQPAPDQHRCGTCGEYHTGHSYGAACQHCGGPDDHGDG